MLFYHNILRSNKAFLNKTYCFHGLYGGDSASLWLGVVKIGSQLSNYFWRIKWVILHDQLLQYQCSMRLIHRVITFPPHAILFGTFYQPALGACWSTPWRAALKSYYSYTSILSECWPSLVLPPRLDRSDYSEPWIQERLKMLGMSVLGKQKRALETLNNLRERFD